jgi:hypothetical protein
VCCPEFALYGCLSGMSLTVGVGVEVAPAKSAFLTLAFVSSIETYWHSPLISRRLQSPAFFQILPTMARHLTHKSICALTSARSWLASNSLRHCHRVAAASTMGKITSQGSRERSSTYAESIAQSSCAAAKHIWTGMFSGEICCAGVQAYSRQ